MQKNGDDLDMIKRINALICRVIHIAQLPWPTTMEYQSKGPANKNISSQKPFKSQRKRPKKSKVKLAKPSVTGKLLTWQSLFTNDTFTKVMPGDDQYGNFDVVNHL